MQAVIKNLEEIIGNEDQVISLTRRQGWIIQASPHVQKEESGAVCLISDDSLNYIAFSCQMVSNTEYMEG